jgi:hypothetical protein
MRNRWFASLVVVALIVATAASAPLARAAAPGGGYVYNYVQGFDARCAPTTSEMTAFWMGTPFYYVGIYIGGGYRSCSPNPNLTASWVSTLGMQGGSVGWGFIPIWVGPQAPQPCGLGGISTNVATADAQGRAEATLAKDAAAALGFTAGTVIYYDMEGYGAGGNAVCDDAVHSFLNGWDVQLREGYGINPGVYGSSDGSGVMSWAFLPNPPWDVWIANISTPMSVWHIPGVSDDTWTIIPPYGRIHQFTTTHPETYNGVTLSIDNNCARGHVAGVTVYGLDGYDPCPGVR